jgi:hypothetical protein
MKVLFLVVLAILLLWLVVPAGIPVSAADKGVSAPTVTNDSAGGATDNEGDAVFSVTLLGQISTMTMNASGELTDALVASSKDDTLTLELASGTKILRDGVRVLHFEATRIEPPPSADGLDAIVAYEFSPAGTEFNPPAHIIVRSDVIKLPENTLGVALARYNVSSSNWEELPTNNLGEIGWPVNGMVDHFSKIGVVVKLAPKLQKSGTIDENGGKGPASGIHLTDAAGRHNFWVDDALNGLRDMWAQLLLSLGLK